MPEQLKDYYIAYFDILGYRGLFSNDEEKNNEIINNILSAFQKINNGIGQTNDSSIMQLANINIEKRMFSDNIVFCMPVENDSFEVFRIVSFLNQICDFQKGLCFEHEIFIRGAIVKDKVILSKHTIQGPGIIKAATLEEKVAIYPRIIIDKSIEEAINQNTQNQAISIVVGKWLEQIIQMFPDKILFLNYMYQSNSLLSVIPQLNKTDVQNEILDKLKQFAPEDAEKVKNSLANQANLEKLLGIHKNILIEKIKQFSTYDNVSNHQEAEQRERVIKKYHWILSYHNLMCSLYKHLEYEIKFAGIIDYRYGTFLIHIMEEGGQNEI